jgi:hypothetical protein
MTPPSLTSDGQAISMTLARSASPPLVFEAVPTSAPPLLLRRLSEIVALQTLSGVDFQG